jgi:tetratricopeptide (TPR) repeat protein
MSNFETDGPSDNEWEDRGDLAWNEFDWEKYLREQDDVIHRYLAFYEQLKRHDDRIDQTAHLMGWDEDSWSSESSETSARETEAEPEVPGSDDDKDEPYTLHKNPIFISTKAIYLSLKRAWEGIAASGSRVPQALALDVHSSLYRGEEQSLLAVQALDFGDYAMAISLFKRALGELNRTFALLNAHAATKLPSVVSYREDALPRLFDLREIWLRVMSECREELERPVEDDDDE